MAVLAAALLLRSQSSAPPTALPPAPVPVAAVAPPRPAPAAVLARQGLEAAQNGAVGAAVDFFRQALEADPSDAETWNRLGVVLARQGEWSEAMEAFRRAIRLSPPHAEAHRNLAVALDRRGRPAEAVAHYRLFLARAAEGHPDRESVGRRLAELTGSSEASARKARP